MILVFAKELILDALEREFLVDLSVLSERTNFVPEPRTERCSPCFVSSSPIDECA